MVHPPVHAIGDVHKEPADRPVLARRGSVEPVGWDSIEQFRAGNRQDLVDKESAELEIITQYLPEQLSEDKLREVINEVIAETGADSPSSMGPVMKEVM